MHLSKLFGLFAIGALTACSGVEDNQEQKNEKADYPGTHYYEVTNYALYFSDDQTVLAMGGRLSNPSGGDSASNCLHIDIRFFKDGLTPDDEILIGGSADSIYRPSNHPDALVLITDFRDQADSIFINGLNLAAADRVPDTNRRIPVYPQYSGICD